MIGPITFDLFVHVKGPNGESGEVTVGLRPGEVPTLQALHKAIGQALEALPEGFELADQDHFCSKLINEKTGRRGTYVAPASMRYDVDELARLARASHGKNDG